MSFSSKGARSGTSRRSLRTACERIRETRAEYLTLVIVERSDEFRDSIADFLQRIRTCSRIVGEIAESQHGIDRGIAKLLSRVALLIDIGPQRILHRRPALDLILAYEDFHAQRVQSSKESLERVGRRLRRSWIRMIGATLRRSHATSAAVATATRVTLRQCIGGHHRKCDQNRHDADHDGAGNGYARHEKCGFWEWSESIKAATYGT